MCLGLVSIHLFALAAPLESALQFFQKGGIFMVPLLLCSMAALTIVLLRALALRRELVLPRVIVTGIEQLPPGGDPENLGRLAGGDPSALGRLTRVGLNHLRWPKVENVEAVQVAARREIMKLEGGLGVLELIVGISPLLGLLGAVTGLVRVFKNLGTGQTAADTLGVALGISEALNTTIVGLAIAIPALVAYTYLNKRVEMFSVELESLLADLLTKCYDVRSARRSAVISPSDDEEAESDEEMPTRSSPLKSTPKLSRPRVEPA